MSLKKSIRKSIAALVAILLLNSNFYLCGIGLSEVIAQDAKEPGIKLNLHNSQYVQFKEEVEIEPEVKEEGEEIEDTQEQEVVEPQYRSGVAIQTKLEVALEQQETNLPISKTELIVLLPSLNGYFPQRANLVDSDTLLSTGKENNNKINQSYDSNSGLLSVSYENEEAYSEYNQESKDEFEIIYIYPAEAYTGNEEEIALSYTVNAKITFETENADLVSELTQTVELKEKDNKGDLVTFGVTELKNEIYKGFMYANVENGTSYDTEFNTVSTLCVLDNNSEKELVLETKDASFIIDDEEGIYLSTEGLVQYVSTELSKSEFDRILGQDGVLEIYTQDTLLATVKYIEVSENEEVVKRLAVIYSDEDIRIVPEDESIVNIEYKSGVTNLVIKTTKPVAEGFINIENKCVIKAAEDYGMDLEAIKGIKISTVANANERSATLLLREPQTKVSVNSSNINFSTLQTGKTTLTINLDSTNASTKLFNSPTITVKLPDGLVGGNILSSPEILNGNGLSIKDAHTEGNVLIIELEGKQTEYDLTNVSGGANIVMDIEDIDFKDTIATHTDKIEVTCTQGKEKVVISQDVNIISKAGLLVLSNIKGFDNQNTVITSIDNEVKFVEIESDAESKEVVQTIDLVNNYDSNITNVEIIGRLGYTNNELNSTFDLTLTRPIEINNAKVYYSIKKDANYSDESWSEEFTREAKAYKIEIQNQEIISKCNTGMKVYYEIPANMQFNETTFNRAEVNYVYNENGLSDSTTIGMETPDNSLTVNSSNYMTALRNEEGNSIPLSVVVTPKISQAYVHSGQRVTYTVKVINNGTEDLNNILVEDIIPDNAIYTYEEVKEGNVTNYIEIAQNAEMKLKQWNIETLKAGETKEFEIMLTMADVTEEQEIVNTVKLTCNNQELLAENKLTLKPAKVEITLSTDADKIIGAIHDVGDIIQYNINVKNVSEEKLKDLKVKFNLSAELEYVEGGLITDDTYEEMGSVDNNTNTFEYNIKSLKTNKEVTICVKAKVKPLSYGLTGNIDTIAYTNINEDIHESNVNTIETKQSAYTIKQSVNVNEAQVLKHNDEVIYTIEVENTGALTGYVNIKDNIPEQLEVMKIEEYKDGELKNSLPTVNQNIEWKGEALKPGEKSIIKITTKVALIETENVNNIEVKNFATFELGEKSINSNETKITIQPELIVKDEGYVPGTSLENELVGKLPTLPKEEVLGNESEQPTTPGKPETPKEPEKPQQPSEPEKPTTQETPKEEPKEQFYTISGVIWLDANKDGKRDEGEDLQQNLTVSLVDTNKGNYALDANGNVIKTTTNAEGKYTFSNLTKGIYAVLFEFDTNKYTVATYQKEGVAQDVNSDAIVSTVTINGTDKKAGLTDKIELTSNKDNIDLGIIENATFDLSLNKEITKITVVDKQGTEEYEYKDGHTAKVDLVAKYMNGANVVVNYKFTITNNGDVTGYVDSLVDSLPSGLEFSSELNKDWYKGSDGKIYTKSLSGVAIKPGNSITVDLVLTKIMTEDNAGTFVNSAELEKISNLENIKEKDENLENNASSAILIISIKTGSAILYIGITILCLAIIGAGVYFIKKKVLNRGI